MKRPNSTNQVYGTSSFLPTGVHGAGVNTCVNKYLKYVYTKAYNSSGISSLFEDITSGIVGETPQMQDDQCLPAQMKEPVECNADTCALFITI